ncbi:MAG TPA: STAS domain-containing protein [Herpetosiphonaceae bacterium]
MSREAIVQALSEHVPHFAQQIVDALLAARLESYMGFSQEQLLNMATAALQAFLRDLSEDQEVAFAAYWQRVAEVRAEQGSRVEDLLRAVYLSEELLHAFVAKRFASDQPLQMWWLGRLHAIVYAGVIYLSQIFIAVRERVIRAQADQIREMSTPIVPLHDGILALPLVGVIDSYRVGQIIETLLNGISEHQAEVVIVDITGVPIVDTTVAHYLLQASRAAQLLGAQVVLVGISAEIAQAIVQLGADLSSIRTRSNMKAGIEYALSQFGLRITG